LIQWVDYTGWGKGEERSNGTKSRSIHSTVEISMSDFSATMKVL